VVVRDPARAEQLAERLGVEEVALDLSVFQSKPIAPGMCASA
jgi:hypothetical protein